MVLFTCKELSSFSQFVGTKAVNMFTFVTEFFAHSDLFSFSSSVKGVSEFGDQTMGHGTGPAVKVMCFNPGSRLKEKLQDAALVH